MRTLTEDLTSEKHLTDCEMSFYSTVEREFNGKTLVIEVEVFVIWDGTPKPELRYYGQIPFDQSIGEGFSIEAEAFLMLSDAEMEDLLDGEEVQDWVSNCRDAQDHEKDSEHYIASTR